MAFARLFGLVAPYGTRTWGYVYRASACGAYQCIKFGALTARALDASPDVTSLMINHHSSQTVEGARVQLIHGRAGLYMLAHLRDGPVARTLMSARSQWRGLSIGTNFEDEEAILDPQTSTRVISRLHRVHEVSVAVDDAIPLRLGTWVVDCSRDLADGLGRCKASEHAAYEAAFGRDYKQSMPSYSWTLPRQGPQTEAKICAANPHRASQLMLMTQLGR